MFGLDELIDSRTPSPATLNGDLGMMSVDLPASGIDWVRAMETLRIENGWSDADLGRSIRLSSSMITQCRTGRRPLPPAARIRVLSGLGFEITRDRLLGVVPDEIREAVMEADVNSSFTRSTLVDRYLDELDDVMEVDAGAGPFLRGLANLCGKDFYDLGRALALSPDEIDSVCSGKTRLPFRAKRAITERFGANELGSLILRLAGS
ncbi:helix-turn-helix domain-containing protein [Cupriavidus sp. TMH.W2]|uniref:helix-turn-helix domain-containing protein n=1 Tax=Cupriavidus sp. TMH.W2 TaxID=3434465 RepID=UPI003D76E139